MQQVTIFKELIKLFYQFLNQILLSRIMSQDIKIFIFDAFRVKKIKDIL